MRWILRFFIEIAKSRRSVRACFLDFIFEMTKSRRSIRVGFLCYHGIGPRDWYLGKLGSETHKTSFWRGECRILEPGILFHDQK